MSSSLFTLSSPSERSSVSHEPDTTMGSDLLAEVLPITLIKDEWPAVSYSPTQSPEQYHRRRWA